MAQRTKKIKPKDLVHLKEELDVPIESISPKDINVDKEGFIYIRLDKHARKYKILAKEQFEKEVVRSFGNLRIGNYEFELGKTYRVLRIPEILDAIARGIIASGGRVHYSKGAKLPEY